MAECCSVKFNSGINVNLIKVSTDVDSSFNEALK
jgi:hypothetical protein